MAQLALNNVKTTVTEILAFFTNYGKHPNLFNTPRKLLQAVTALEDVKQLKQIHNKIIKDIKYNQKQLEDYINKKKEEISVKKEE